MSTLHDFVKRILNTLWQSFISSLSVAQVVNALANGRLSEIGILALAALGAAVAAVVALLKNLAFKPTATGVVGLVERLAATFVEGAAAAIPVDLLTGLFTHFDSNGLRTVGLAALGGGLAAVLSLVQHSAQGLPRAAGPVVAMFPFVFEALDRTSLSASDARQFIAFLSALDLSVLQKHLDSGDFSDWLAGSLRNTELAQTVRQIESSRDTSESKRIHLLSALNSAYPPR
ncbi:MAG: hypothetical protein JWO93_1834 [Micrococcaceae bacterium]|jgi:hypothetical protein|nr:hypothetical protein [Micrococcaceae bacterium]